MHSGCWELPIPANEGDDLQSVPITEFEVSLGLKLHIHRGECPPAPPRCQRCSMRIIDRKVKPTEGWCMCGTVDGVRPNGNR